MIRFFAGHPTAANLLVIAIIAMGLAAAPGLKRETFPDFTPAEVEVRVLYPGASAEEVEQAVCQRLEDATEQVNFVDEARCEARESVATLVVEMQEGGDFARFLDQVKTEVESIDDFPGEVETPTIRERGLTDFVVALAVTGPMSVRDLKAYAEELKDRLLLEGVASQVRIGGFSDHQFRIEIPSLTLRQLGLSVHDVARVVEQQSTDLPSGTITTDARELLVRFADERRSLQDLEDLIVVGSETGAEIRLGDIANISDRFELDEAKIFIDGQRAASLEITKNKAEDTLDVMARLKDFLEVERARAPPTVRYTLTRDVSSIVQDRLDLLLRNGMQGLALVMAVMALFFGVRFAFWVALGLPVSFLGTIFAMALMGYSINMITMVALLIAIGLLMDDSIVIAENIATKLKDGLEPVRAAVEGTREVLPGVAASFLTTISVFGPLAFMEGQIGKVLKVLPVVLGITLAVSLVEAFLILPHHLAHAGRHAAGQRLGRVRAAFERGFERLRTAVLGSLVDAAVCQRYLTIGLAICAFLLSVAMPASGVLKFRPFPDVDGNVVQARLLLPPGTPLAQTEAIVARIEGALADVAAELEPLQPAGRRLVQQVNTRYGHNLDAFEEGPHVATVTVDLLEAEERRSTIDEILGLWRERVGELPDVLALNFKEPQIGPAGGAIEIRLAGEDLDAIKVASLDLQEWLRGYRGVVDLSDDLRPGKPELRLRLREGATALGLDAGVIAAQLRAAFFGATAREIQVGPESYEIDLRLDSADRDSIGDLESFAVTAPGGAQVPLSNAAIVEEGRGWARIQRIDGQRVVTVRGDVDGRIANAAAITADTVARFVPGLLERHPGVTLSLEGQAAESGKTGASIQRGFLLGLLGVYALLSFLFRSYIEPLVVMAAIPLALIGAVWGHILMGLEFSMPSTIGFVSLAGIVVNDSILLVLFVKRNHARGMAVPEAAMAASRERFRAVVMTSLTTIVGLLPILTETNLQAQVLIPLITSLVFGLLASTVLVLLVVPSIYAVIDDLGGSTLARAAPAEAVPGAVSAG